MNQIPSRDPIYIDPNELLSVKAGAIKCALSFSQPISVFSQSHTVSSGQLTKMIISKETEKIQKKVEKSPKLQKLLKKIENETGLIVHIYALPCEFINFD